MRYRGFFPSSPFPVPCSLPHGRGAGKRQERKEILSFIVQEKKTS
ncbi:hypothetical protein BJP36_38150 [Moorena producens JHB]|uniref:Uncharacterized protein n=1 Tax=Moorena producens (strain JHB) TaxID=1454205 RepID=A0A9Q9SUM4_MOOP1|nr:hypothetical protein [Moorena producens]WAN69917.1 hypothetical protein BJP36_38150 [Moorena producens JHB]